MDFSKIDWLNHSIAFASSVVGIFIAFQLDDWQERRAKREEMEVTLNAIKLEIEGNLRVYHENDSTLGAFIEFFDFYNANLHEGGLLLSKRDLAEALRRFPERFGQATLFKKLNDTLAIYKVAMNINVTPAAGVSTGNWEAAISSGILSYLDHHRTVLLTQSYEWITKDLGYSDDQLYGSMISFREFDNIDEIIRNYRLIIKVSRMRYERVKKYYDQIIW